MVKDRGPTFVGLIYLMKQINDVVGLAVVVLYVIILGRDAEFYELLFESAGLLK